jgi:hypothetical protein
MSAPKDCFLELYLMPEKEQTVDDFSYEKYPCSEKLIKE